MTNSRGVFAVPIGEYVTGMVLRIHQPTTTWAADQAAHRWPTSEPPTLEMVRDRRAVIVGYGAIGREVARQLSALGMRIVAVKPRPENRDDTGYCVPGTGDPDGSIPERIVGDDAARRGLPRRRRPHPDHAADRGVARDRRARRSSRRCPRTRG